MSEEIVRSSSNTVSQVSVYMQLIRKYSAGGKLILPFENLQFSSERSRKMIYVVDDDDKRVVLLIFSIVALIALDRQTDNDYV